MPNNSLFTKNKKANLLSIWWFISLIVIAFGIVSGVTIFYSQIIDVREMEAGVMADKVINCIVDKGYNQEGFFGNLSAGNIDVLSSCNFNKKLFEESLYFIKISIADETGNLIKEIKYGNNAMEKDCEIGQNVEAKKFPICTQREVLILNSGIKNKLIVSAASNVEGKGVSR